MNLAHSNALDASKTKEIFRLKKYFELKFGIEFQKILGLGIEKDLNIKLYLKLRLGLGIEFFSKI